MHNVYVESESESKISNLDEIVKCSTMDELEAPSNFKGQFQVAFDRLCEQWKDSV